MHEHSNVSAGVRAGLPLVLPTLALGVSFGVLARPVMGAVAPIVMSILVFSGAAQFAALSVLAAGGGARRRDRRGHADERPLAAHGLCDRAVAARRAAAPRRAGPAIVDASFVSPAAATAPSTAAC